MCKNITKLLNMKNTKLQESTTTIFLTFSEIMKRNYTSIHCGTREEILTLRNNNTSENVKATGLSFRIVTMVHCVSRQGFCICQYNGHNKWNKEPPNNTVALPHQAPDRESYLTSTFINTACLLLRDHNRQPR